MLKTELTFTATPGIEYHYSNLGYMVLGALIAKVVGKPAISYISSEILGPLGMNATCWNPPHVHWLIGHSRHRDKLIQEPVTSTEYDGAVFGGLWSTVSDLCRWIRFMMDLPPEQELFRQVLSPSSRKFMQQSLVKVPITPTMIEDVYYGLGLRNNVIGGFTFTGHSGGLPGYGSHFRWCMELGCGVVVMSNLTYAPLTDPCQKLMAKIVDNISSLKLPIPELIHQRALELFELICNGWNERIVTQLFASNFFLDNPTELFRENLLAAADRIDRNKSRPWVLMQRGLQARVILEGDELFSLMLAPAENARVQQVVFPWLKSDR
jgi:CubicO group peptidase (beta-lactamase class C family)